MRTSGELIAPGPEVGPGIGPSRPRRATWAVGIAAVVFVILVLAVDRSALGASLSAARHLRWWWLLPAAALEIASLAAAAEGHRRLLAAAGARIQLRTVLAIAFGATAVAFSVPVAPGPFSASYSVRQYVTRGIGFALAGWVLVVLWMTATASLSVVLFAGAVVSGSYLAGLAGVVSSLVFLLPPLAVLLALRFPAVRAWLRTVAGGSVNLLRRRPGLAGVVAVGALGTMAAGLLVVGGIWRSRPATTAGIVAACLTGIGVLVVAATGGRLGPWLRRTIEARPDPAAAVDALLARAGSIRAPRRVYAEVFALSLANWLLDVAVLVLAIHATGAPIPWNGVLLAYGAGIVAGSLWPAPGGIGAVEAAMAAALVAAGLAAGPALAAVLVYRLASFWMLLGIGWVTMGLLTRRSQLSAPML